MRILQSSLLVSLSAILICGAELEAVSITVVEQDTVCIQGVQEDDVTYALRMGGDTLLVLSRSGLRLQTSRGKEWHQIVELVPDSVEYPVDACSGQKYSRLVSPKGLWRIEDGNNSSVLVYERYCSALRRLNATNTEETFLEPWGSKSDEEWIERVNVQGNLALCGLFRKKGRPSVLLQWAGQTDSRSVFYCPDRLAHSLDSVGLSNASFCIPALNPHDSLLWLAIIGHSHVYMVTMKGELRDSMSINQVDYRLPPRLRSRIRSDAVIEDWLAQWAYITAFSYAPPGYFIMQYTVKRGTDSLPAQFSTRVWDTQKQVVKLDVNPYWRIAGVQSDGRILFATRESDSTGSRSVIYVTRIEP